MYKGKMNLLECDQYPYKGLTFVSSGSLSYFVSRQVLRKPSTLHDWYAALSSGRLGIFVVSNTVDDIRIILHDITSNYMTGGFVPG